MILKITTVESGTGLVIGANNCVNRRSLASTIIKAVGTIAWLCLLVRPVETTGQTNNLLSIYPRNRYLLVVETSHGMARRTEVMRAAVQGLFQGGLSTQAHNGDSLGLWTFNEDLNTGVFPLQQWSPDAQKSITDRVDSFLKAQKFEKHARFDKLMPALEGLAHNSRFITVILVCMGETDIRGTPFDAQINGFFRTWRLKQKDAGTPFIIALRAQAGQFVDFTTNASAWPVELPPLPKELTTPIMLPQPVVRSQTPKSVATSSVPPLIVTGKKHEATPSIDQSQTAPLVATFSVPSNTTTPDATPNTPPITSQYGSTAAVAQSAPVTSSASPPSNSAPPLETRGSDASPGSIPLANKSPETTSPAKPETPVPVVSGEALVQSQHSTSPQASAAPSARVAEPSPKDKAVQVASAVPVNGMVYTALLIFIGLVSLGAIAGAIWLWRLRLRRASEPSLITESLDRRKG